MKNDYIYDCVQKLIKKYETNNPFELMKVLDITHTPSHLKNEKGYCVIFFGLKYAAVNTDLDEREKMIVAAHELGHLVLHPDFITAAAHHELNIYDTSNPTEYEANMFAAELLLDDDEVDDLVREDGMDYLTIAKILSTNPKLLEFKLLGMKKRGYQYNISVPPKSTFLA